MSIKRKKVAFLKPNPGDLYSMACVQTELLGNSISPEARYKNGFIDFVLSTDALVGVTRLGLSKVAISKRSSRLCGFVAGVPYSIANRISYLSDVVPDVSEYFKYACFVHLCVDPQKSKSGLGTQLLRQLEHITAEQKFEALIAPIPYGNEIAQIFFESKGFQSLLTPLVTDRVLLYKKLPSVA